VSRTFHIERGAHVSIRRAPQGVIPAKAGTQAGCVPVRSGPPFVMRDALGPGFRRDDGCLCVDA